jgi:pyruvate dehydrogenase E2 component (dihydrolipoamide acetyltransferase)
MSLEFRLPDIGEGVLEGEVVRWLVREGDVVREDQPMVEVMTDKATVEIPSPRRGRIRQIIVAEGKTCPVGAPLVLIGAMDDNEPLPLAVETRPGSTGAMADGPSARAKAEGAASGVGSVAGAGVLAVAAVEPNVLATPATRKLARQLGVALSDLAASAGGGRITSDDVRGSVSPASPPKVGLGANGAGAAARPRGPTPGSESEERVPFRGLRKRIADNLARSVATAAHYTYVDECDATELVALRARAQAHLPQGAKLSYLPFFIKAVIAALRRFPQVNSRLDAEANELVLLRAYHIGIATAAPDGLVVPVLRDADRLSIPELALEIERLSQLARAGKCAPRELSGSTFTLTSLGTLGGVMATPILNFPEVAILSIHKIVERPVVRDGNIVARKMANLSLSLDHRVIDGYEGARFLGDVIGSIEDPSRLFLTMI